jgi:hypothetical protein
MESKINSSFSSPVGTRELTKWLFGATLLLTVAGVVSGVMQMELLSRGLKEEISFLEAHANDNREQVIGSIRLGLYLATAVAFLVWFYRTRKNLSALGGFGFKHSPGWAVGGFFTPGLNLFLPMQVMREIWHASNPARLESDESASGPAERNRLGTPLLVGWWWALFIGMNVLAIIAFRTGSVTNPTPYNLQAMTLFSVLSDLVSFPCAFLAIAIINRISSWQTERHSLIIHRSTLSPPSPATSPSFGV